MGKRAEAQAAYRESIDIKEKLAADFPTVPSYAVYLGGGYCNFGTWSERTVNWKRRWAGIRRRSRRSNRWRR